MKEIVLTRNKVSLVDDEDFEAASKYLWYAKKSYASENLFYAARSVGPKGKQKTVYLHNFILGNIGLHDHIDGDGLNNQRYNLRPATGVQNGRNHKKRKDNLSGFKGVYWVNREQRWVSCLQVDKKLLYFGYFKDKTEAAKAYDLGAVKYFGQFAKTNQMLGLLD